MKNQYTPKPGLRIVAADLIIYGNLAFTFVFFSAAFDKGCNNSSSSYKPNEVAAAQKSNTPSALAEKGSAKTAAIVSSAK